MKNNNNEIAKYSNNQCNDKLMINNMMISIVMMK